MPMELRKAQLGRYLGLLTVLTILPEVHPQQLIPAGLVKKFGTGTFRHDHWINCIAFSPDGKQLASGGSDFTLRLWDRRSGKEVREFLKVSDRKSPFAGARIVNCVALSNDGKLIAAGTGDSFVHVWEISTGRQTLHSQSHQGPVLAVVFAPDSKTLFSAGTDQTVRLWDPGTGKELRQFATRDQCNALAINKEGKWLVSGCNDGNVRVWDVASGKEIRIIEAHKGPVLAVALSQDGRQLAAGGQDNSIRIWDISQDRNPQHAPVIWAGIPWAGTIGFVPIVGGIEFLRLNQDGAVLAGHSQGVHSLVFGHDGQSLISAGHDGSIRIWDLAQKRVQRMLQAGSPVRALALSPDGELLASGHESCCLRFWSWKQGQERPVAGGHHAAIDTVQFGGLNDKLVSLGKDLEIHVWELRTGVESAARFSLPLGQTAVCLSPKDEIVASGEADGTLHLWNWSTRKEVRSWKAGATALTALSFSRDGKWIGSGFKDASITVWEAATGKEIGSLSGGEGSVTQLVFASNGRILASASGSERIDLWDLTTWSELRRLGESGEEIQSLAFDPDGQLLAVGTRGGVVRLWHLPSGKSLWNGENPPGSVMSLCFSADGRTLAAGSWLTVRLWEVATGRERDKFEGISGDATAIAFGPDARSLAVGNGAAGIWLLDLAQENTGLKRDLNKRDLNTLWTTLSATDGPRAYRAVWRLAASPRDTIPFLQDLLKPVPVLAEDQKRQIAKLVTALDQEDFQARQQAESELRKHLVAAEPQLREALSREPSSEVRGRLEMLLQDLDTPERQRTHWQGMRATEVLEKIANKEAHDLLRALAQGRPEASLTREARSALGRLEGRKMP